MQRVELERVVLRVVLVQRGAVAQQLWYSDTVRTLGYSPLGGSSRAALCCTAGDMLCAVTHHQPDRVELLLRIAQRLQAAAIRAQATVLEGTLQYSTVIYGTL